LSRSPHSLNRGSIHHQADGIVPPPQNVQPDPHISVLLFTWPMKNVSFTQQGRHLTSEIGKTERHCSKYHVRQAWMQGKFGHSFGMVSRAAVRREGSELDQ
jgi:hypothetical protein